MGAQLWRSPKEHQNEIFWSKWILQWNVVDRSGRDRWLTNPFSLGSFHAQWRCELPRKNSFLVWNFLAFFGECIVPLWDRLLWTNKIRLALRKPYGCLHGNSIRKDFGLLVRGCRGLAPCKRVRADWRCRHRLRPRSCSMEWRTYEVLHLPFQLKNLWILWVFEHGHHVRFLLQGLW